MLKRKPHIVRNSLTWHGIEQYTGDEVHSASEMFTFYAHCIGELSQRRVEKTVLSENKQILP